MADNLPAVSFLKAPEYQDGHAGYSDPIDGPGELVALRQSGWQPGRFASAAWECPRLIQQ